MNRTRIEHPYPLSPEASRRFWSKVKPDDESDCLLWQAAKSVEGYGRFWHGKFVAAHRVAYKDAYGDLSGDLTLDHLCRNPSCVNVAHLEPVSALENIRRAYGGEYGLISENGNVQCRFGHEIVADNLYVTPQGHNRCRECRRKRNKERSVMRTVCEYCGGDFSKGNINKHRKRRHRDAILALMDGSNDE